MTDPSKLQNTRQQRVDKSSSLTPDPAEAQVNGDGQSDDGSEGEISSSVTISALLSKLDSVRVKAIVYNYMYVGALYLSEFKVC